MTVFFSFNLNPAWGGETPTQVTQLELMKDGVTKLELFLMPASYQLDDWDLKEGLEKGYPPSWRDACYYYYVVPVVDRQYDSEDGIRIPCGDYRLFLYAVGRDGWSPSFYATSDPFTVRQGENLSPELDMIPLGMRVDVVPNITVTNPGNAGASFLFGDGSNVTKEMYFQWDEEAQRVWADDVFIPFGVRAMSFFLITDKKVVSPFVGWGHLDAENQVVIQMEPALEGGSLTPVLIWPEE